MNAIEELERYYTNGSAHHGAPIDRGPSPLGESASPATAEQASTSADHEEFVTHILTKTDTLAGLAVQYNVAVSDIKRANGLMSENMMWCRYAFRASWSR
jgi:LysM domain